MAAKTPNAAAISRLLAAAGFDRSESSASRIKGYRRRTEGFIAEGRGTGVVRVHHTSGAFRPSDVDRAKSREIEDQYAEKIREAGYGVDRDEWGELSITAKTED
jgi:hypothetical protein